jgi:hypothetical protein
MLDHPRWFSKTATTSELPKRKFYSHSMISKTVRVHLIITKKLANENILQLQTSLRSNLDILADVIVRLKPPWRILNCKGLHLHAAMADNLPSLWLHTVPYFPCAQSFVLAYWLSFDWSRLLGLSTSAFLTHLPTTLLQLKNPLSANFKKMSFCKCFHFNYL